MTPHVTDAWDATRETYDAWTAEVKANGGAVTALPYLVNGVEIPAGRFGTEHPYAYVPAPKPVIAYLNASTGLGFSLGWVDLIPGELAFQVIAYLAAGGTWQSVIDSITEQAHEIGDELFTDIGSALEWLAQQVGDTISHAAGGLFEGLLPVIVVLGVVVVAAVKYQPQLTRAARGYREAVA